MSTPTRALAPVPGVLWSVNFRWYFAARTTSLLGDAMLPVALSVGLLALGYGAAGVGYALGAWMAALAACMLFGGVLADRFTPRRMMILADLIRFVMQGLIAVLFWIGSPALTPIVVMQALSGAATALFQPGVASMVPQVADDVQKANGILRMVEASAGVAGPAIAGVLIGFTGPEIVFGVYALTYAVSGISLLQLRLPPRQRDDGESFLRQLATGWLEFRRRTWLWSVIGIFAVYGCFVAGVSLPLSADAVVRDLGSAALGIAMAAFGAGGVVGGALAMRTRGGRPLARGSLGWLLFAVYPLTVALHPPLPLLAAGWLIAGAGLAYWGVIWATTVQTQIPADMLNRVYAYDVTGSLVSLALGRVLAGPLSDAVGQDRLLLASGLLGILCAIALLATPATRRLRT